MAEKIVWQEMASDKELLFHERYPEDTHGVLKDQLVPGGLTPWLASARRSAHKSQSHSVSVPETSDALETFVTISRTRAYFLETIGSSGLALCVAAHRLPGQQLDRAGRQLCRLLSLFSPRTSHLSMQMPEFP